MSKLNDKIYAKLVEVGKNNKATGRRWHRFSKFEMVIFTVLITALFTKEIYTNYTGYQKVFGNFDKSTKVIEMNDEKRIEFYPKPLVFGNERYFAKYGVSNDSIRLRFDGVAGFLTGNVDIPAKAIVGCSQQSYGKNGRTTVLILNNQQYGFSIADSTYLKDWCFANHLPVFNSQEITDWRQNNKPLPNPKTIENRLANKANYENTLNQFCR
ncbi:MULTISPECIES: hypothetical protein [unclassified Moraxella]|uniref:hypothetical protein n=1 Tax=unclassified Moraxella TaxID=2685852 RepID=UPI003AF6F25B